MIPLKSYMAVLIAITGMGLVCFSLPISQCSNPSPQSTVERRANIARSSVILAAIGLLMLLSGVTLLYQSPTRD